MKKNKTENAHGKRRAKIILCVLAALIFVCSGAFCIYMRPLEMAVIPEEIFADADGITVVSPGGGALAFVPENARTGLVFYQGAKVDGRAYAPLMRALAEKGILAAVADSPFNFALFGIGAAEDIREKFPDVTSWYIGGHSLGGVAAGTYLAEHAADLDGLVLLGSYVTKDISDSGLTVVSVFGENDGVLRRDAYEEARPLLPSDFRELVIPGGNHAGFACYGPQPGDGEALISKDEQIELTADFIAQSLLP